MALREIIHEGDERLRKICRPVTDFGPKTQELIDDMIDTLQNTSNGVGLAANQVGIVKRIFIIDFQDEKGLKVYINPEIIKVEGEQKNTEGCLSVPGWWGEVKRPRYVTCRAKDRNGNEFEVRETGMYAVCLMHETGHLNGELYKDHVIPGTMYRDN